MAARAFPFSEPIAARLEPQAALRAGCRTLARARRRLTELPGRPRTFLGRCAVRVEFGHSPAMPRQFLVVDPRQDQGRNQPSHFLERLDAVLDPGRLLSGRALVEQEDKLPPISFSAARVRALAQRSNMLGREGMMLRSATCIAAEDAAPSAPGVSRIAEGRPHGAERRAGRRAAPEAMTSISPPPRVLAQFASEPCGSMSMTQPSLSFRAPRRRASPRSCFSPSRLFE